VARIACGAVLGTPTHEIRTLGGPTARVPFIWVRSQKAVTKKEMSVKISELAEAKHLR